MVKKSFSSNPWHMTTFLYPLDALIPKIPFSIFGELWVRVTSEARGSVSLGFGGSRQLSPFWGGGPARGLYQNAPPPFNGKRACPLTVERFWATDAGLGSLGLTGAPPFKGLLRACGHVLQRQSKGPNAVLGSAGPRSAAEHAEPPHPTSRRPCGCRSLRCFCAANSCGRAPDSTDFTAGPAWRMAPAPARGQRPSRRRPFGHPTPAFWFGARCSSPHPLGRRRLQAVAVPPCSLGTTATSLAFTAPVVLPASAYDAPVPAYDAPVPAYDAPVPAYDAPVYGMPKGSRYCCCLCTKDGPEVIGGRIRLTLNRRRLADDQPQVLAGWRSAEV